MCARLSMRVCVCLCISVSLRVMGPIWVGAGDIVLLQGDTPDDAHEALDEMLR